MSDNKTCRQCQKSFKTKGARRQHEMAAHPKHKDDEQSMADQFIDGYLNRAMGIANEDWLEDML